MASNKNEYKQLLEQAGNDLGDKLLESGMNYGYPLFLIRPEDVVEVGRYFKEKHYFIYLVDVTGTDRFTTDDRFEVIYNVISLRTHQRIFIKTRVEEDEPELDSVYEVWEAASWHEREVYDMFGIAFRNHPDPRRIYMPEDFKYYPLRKEFPLLGVPGSIELPNTSPDQD